MRKELIEKKIEQEMQRMMDCKRMLKGTLSEVSIKKNGADGGMRVIHQLTYKGSENVTKTIYVRKTKLEEAEEMTTNYRKAKGCLERIAQLNEELFKMP